MSSKNATRKRGSKAVAQARGAGGNRVAIIAGVVVVLVLAAFVVGGVVLASKKQDTAVQTGGIPAVTAGVAGVPVALEIYRGVTHEFIKMGRILPEARQAHADAAAALHEAFTA